MNIVTAANYRLADGVSGKLAGNILVDVVVKFGDDSS